MSSSPVFLFCDFSKFSWNFQIISRAPFPLIILLQLFKYLSSTSVHLTISVCCSPALFINSITNFRFRSASKLCSIRLFVFFLLPARADLNLFYLLIARTIFHWTKIFESEKNSKTFFAIRNIGGKIHVEENLLSVVGRESEVVGKQINQKLKVQQKAGKCQVRWFWICSCFALLEFSAFLITHN